MTRFQVLVITLNHYVWALQGFSPSLTPCPLYQALTSSGGVGVFAGQDFQQGQIVEFSPTFYTSSEAYSNNIVQDYVVNHNSSHGSLHGGYSLVMNHCDRPNMRYPDEKDQMKAKRNISKGEELCINYGKAWWKLRGYKKLDPMNLEHDGDEMSIIPGCPQRLTTLVPVIPPDKSKDEITGRESQHPLRSWKKDDIVEGNFQNEDQWYRGKIEQENEDGNYDILYDDGDAEKNVSKEQIRLAPPLTPPVYMKVVANSYIPVGTTIEVSRSLIVPRRFWDDDQYELDEDDYPNDIRHRIWRVQNDDSHSIGLLNYGMGAFYRAASSNSSTPNHLSSDYGHLLANVSTPNVLYREYKGIVNWKREKKTDDCFPAILIEFIALRDILAGEELVIEMSMRTDQSKHSERFSHIRLDKKCIDHFISSDRKAMLNGTSSHPLLRRATFESKDVENATLYWFNPGTPPSGDLDDLSMLERWGSLDIGELIRVNTYVGHRWIVQVNGSTVREWRIHKDPAYKNDVMRFELYQKEIEIELTPRPTIDPNDNGDESIDSAQQHDEM